MSIYKDLLFLHGYLLGLPGEADSNAQVSAPAPSCGSGNAGARSSEPEPVSAIGDAALAAGGCV